MLIPKASHLIHRYARYVAPLAVLFCIYLLFSLRSIHEPLLGDSYVLPWCAERLNRGEAFLSEHPALYINLLSALIGCGAHSPEGYRILGLAGFLLTLVLIVLVTRRLTREYLPGILAAFLYAINPMAIKGSFLTDIDTTVLPPLLLAFILPVLKYRESDELKAYVVLSVSFAVLLWAKLTTPFILLTALALYHFFRAEYARGAVRTGIIAAAGFVLFLATWFAYPYLADSSFSPASVFVHIKDALHATNAAENGGLATLLRSLLLFLLWVSPGLFALCLIAQRGT